jgi:hypothetical protein
MVTIIASNHFESVGENILLSVSIISLLRKNLKKVMYF